MRLLFLFLVCGLFASVFGKTIMMNNPNSDGLLNELNSSEESSNGEPTGNRLSRCGQSGHGGISGGINNPIGGGGSGGGSGGLGGALGTGISSLISMMINPIGSFMKIPMTLIGLLISFLRMMLGAGAGGGISFGI